MSVRNSIIAAIVLLVGLPLAAIILFWNMPRASGVSTSDGHGQIVGINSYKLYDPASRLGARLTQDYHRSTEYKKPVSLTIGGRQYTTDMIFECKDGEVVSLGFNLEVPFSDTAPGPRQVEFLLLRGLQREYRGFVGYKKNPDQYVYYDKRNNIISLGVYNDFVCLRVIAEGHEAGV